ncbi:MAG: hypothetical protein ACRC7J_07895 [Vibrio ordalii]
MGVREQLDAQGDGQKRYEPPCQTVVIGENNAAMLYWEGLEF